MQVLNVLVYNMGRRLDSADDVLCENVLVDSGYLHVFVVGLFGKRVLGERALGVDVQNISQRAAERPVRVDRSEFLREALVQLMHLLLLGDVQRLKGPRKHLQKPASERGDLAHNESLAKEL